MVQILCRDRGMGILLRVSNEELLLGLFFGKFKRHLTFNFLVEMQYILSPKVKDR